MDDGYPDEAVAVAYRHLFEGGMGDAVLQDLAIVCHADKVTFTADPLMTAFNEGQRSIYLYIKDRMQQRVVDDAKTFETGEY